jgi:DNA-binding beta-propeller fold protein YncE
MRGTDGGELMNRSTWRNLGIVAAGAAVVAVAAISNRGAQAQVPPTAGRLPVFEVDATWPKLPNNWVLGQTPGIAVDGRDHVYLLHRPRTVPEELRSRAAPAVLEFDEKGAFVSAWGGPGAGFDWPDSEHGIFVDSKDNVWIGGSSPTSQSLTRRSDDMLLKFTRQGKFLLQIGGPDASKGNADTSSVNKPADAFMYAKTNEIFVADGYGNRRIIVFDADKGTFKRMWGGSGNPPQDAPAPAARGTGPATAAARPPAPAAQCGALLARETPAPEAFGGPVHSVKVSNDGMVYVADRANRRVQVFSLDGRYQTQTFINPAGPASGSAAGLTLSPDGAQQFMYVADYGNSRVLALDRKSLQVLYQFGGYGTAPGQFRCPHHLSADSKGNLYVVEVLPGNRAQRFAFKGLSESTPSNALTPAQLSAPQTPPPSTAGGRAGGAPQ